MVLYVLYESASGYALFERVESEEISNESPEYQKSILDFGRFTQIVKLNSFLPFPSAESALENINSISEGLAPELLTNFLEMHLPQSKKKKGTKFQLGVGDEKIGTAIGEALGVSCVKNKLVAELLRGIRLHFTRFIKELKEGDLEKAQLGLGHAYSRAKVKFNVNRADNMVIQTISLLDTLDKDLNTFAMRVKEWYSWHFPELVKIVSDNTQYARTAFYIKNKAHFTEEKLAGLEEILMDADKAQEVYDALKSSMGTDISDLDMLNIEKFAQRVIRLAEYRSQLQAYLLKKMQDIAPNLSTLIGEQVAARLISHAGSLTNLAKYPASTVQILGAEKALFRALKTRGNTPKYGLIFHSSYIGRASTKNKGRISRYLANKCSIASRIDAFSDRPTMVFGQKLGEQVEERLSFYDEGAKPRKNLAVMQEAMKAAQQEAGEEEEEEGMDVVKKGKKDKKKKGEETPKKQKGGKKRKRSGDDEEEEEEKKEEKKTPKKKKKQKKEEAAAATPTKKDKKKKKKKSK
ncbi:snoRNP complex protein nop56 [Balamuthia mandrillaris]